MEHMKVKTLRPHPYGGVERMPGEEYDMEERFYEVMAAMGNVVYVDTLNYRTRDLTAQEPKKYRRRDLQAK